MPDAGTLYVVSTPIGNMGDFSFRAVDVLRSVQVVLAEDTRHSRLLLGRYDIRTPTTAYHEHNEAAMTPRVIARMRGGDDVALISDAGTPLISDPGRRLVQAAIDAGMKVVPVPGASAVLAALTGAGLDTAAFTFLGFPPRKGKARTAMLDAVVSSPHTTVLFEAPSRVADSLRELADRAGDRPAVVARELTKQFEEFQRGTLASLAAHFRGTPARGEVVIVVAGAPAPTSAAADESALRDEARALRARGMSVRDVTAELARRGTPRNLAYKIARAASVCLVVAIAGIAAAAAPSRMHASDTRLTIARLQYDGGGDWYANPSSLPNLLAAIRERTSLAVEKVEARVRLTDEQLWDFPFLHVTGHGNIRFSDTEVQRLREYLLRGGFLHVSDNYGIDSSFRREIARVFPDRPLVDVPLSHPIYHIVYDFPRGLPKIHEHDGKPARGFGIFIGDRLAVFYDYECDLGNGWEDPEVYHDPPALHEAALRMGVNLFTYAIASRPVP